MKTVVVAAAVVFEGAKVLVTKRPDELHFGGYWEFPGGKVEEDEDPKAAVVRECQEECGIEVEVEDIFDVVFHRYPSKNVLLLFYRCRKRSGHVQHIGVTDHRYVTPDELMSLALPPANASVVERLRRSAS